MYISEFIKNNKQSLSFEVFPPKTGDMLESVKNATEEIAKLNPAFVSVTYGAGGGTSDYTIEIAKNIKEKYNVTPLAHLSCISSTKEQVSQQLKKIKASGIENILALRGDIPKDGEGFLPEYRYASELITQIKAEGNFCIGAACYPESHPESKTGQEDIMHLKEKVDCGCDFLTTQMFFDNNILYNFMYRIMKANINVPVVAGIMPVTNSKQIKRICSISGTCLPQRFCRIVDHYGDEPQAMMQAGIAYATEQIIDLFANGVSAVHVYSMNKPEVAKQIMDNLSYIIK